MNVFIAFKAIRISLFFIIIYFNNISSIKGEHYKAYIFFSSKITIKINSSGSQQILFSTFKIPDSIIINNSPINIRERILILTESFNTIELTWNSDLTTCNKIFSKCSNITEVDLLYVS